MCPYNHKLNGVGDELTGNRFELLLCCKIISQVKTICQIKGPSQPCSYTSQPCPRHRAQLVLAIAAGGQQGEMIRSGNWNTLVSVGRLLGSFRLTGHVIVVLGIITSIIKGEKVVAAS